MKTTKPPAFRFGLAWVALCLSLALHVTDEALTGFLDVYNPVVKSLRTRLPFFPMPTFTFRDWLTDLIIGICLLLVLSIFAFRGARWMIPVSFVFGTLMLFNGLAHIAGSIYMGRLMPGAYSSPFLLAGAIYLLVTTAAL